MSGGSNEDKLTGRLSDFMAKLSFEPSKKEVDTAVKNIYNQKKKADKEGKAVDKPKRKLSAWNIFYKEQSAILKKSEEDKDKSDRMSAKEKMAYIAGLWKSKSSNDADEFHEAKSSSEDEAEPEVEPEPEPEPEPKPEPKNKGKGGGFKGGMGGGFKGGAKSSTAKKD